MSAQRIEELINIRGKRCRTYRLQWAETRLTHNWDTPFFDVFRRIGLPIAYRPNRRIARRNRSSVYNDLQMTFASPHVYTFVLYYISLYTHKLLYTCLGW